MGYATVVGVGVGAAVLALFLAAGFLVANWRLKDFFAHLTPVVVGWVILAGGIAIALFAVPIAMYLRFRVATPLIVLSLIVVGWTGIGIGQGIPPTASFGLAAYAFAFSPLYLVLFLLFGAVEQLARR